MNTKLVESLVQVIEALPSEDYLLLQGQLTDRNIQKTADVCGGYARIRKKAYKNKLRNCSNLRGYRSYL